MNLSGRFYETAKKEGGPHVCGPPTLRSNRVGHPAAHPDFCGDISGLGGVFLDLPAGIGHIDPQNLVVRPGLGAPELAASSSLQMRASPSPMRVMDSSSPGVTSQSRHRARRVVSSIPPMALRSRYIQKTAGGRALSGRWFSMPRCPSRRTARPPGPPPERPGGSRL